MKDVAACVGTWTYFSSATTAWVLCCSCLLGLHQREKLLDMDVMDRIDDLRVLVVEVDSYDVLGRSMF
jgi:hypothetical protein